ncbi:MAG: RDD family protein [Micropepsaceae bacterium]
MVHAVKRKLTTIFCADVVGYSRLMGVDEHGTLKRLKECRELIQAFIERHRGRVVSWSGDAVLADFSSVVESVQCAVEIQRELKAQNDTVPERERMDFRIGINLGDVMIDDHDIFGEGVNIAARLQGIATPGGILISGSVHDQVKNKLALGFNFMGHQQVKNISEQVPVFVVAHDGGASMPIGAVSIGGAPSIALKAPGLMPLRMVAGVIDGLLACVLALAMAVMLQGAMGPVFTLDAPFTWIASERTISTDLPSLEIADGGETSRTTIRSVVERNYMGFLTQTYRRTATEAKTNGATAVQIREALLAKRGGAEISRPSLWMAAVGIYFLLLVLCEGLLTRGASPGKLVMGLRVSNTKGGKPGLIQATVRNLSKVISIAPALLGILMAFFSKKRQMLHDVLTGCYVHDAK